jgi:hypothetical protein
VYQQPQQVQQQPQTPQLPFQPEEWDPFNMEQQSALMSYQLSQALQPFAQFIQQQQQENQLLAMQQQNHYLADRESESRKMMNEHIPNFSELADKRDKGTANELERILVDTAYQRFTEAMQSGFNQQHWFDPRIQQEVFNQIAPGIKTLAEKLGITQAAKPQTPPPKPGAYVEPSAPVPQQSGNAFDAAYKKGDLTGMISALGSRV